MTRNKTIVTFGLITLVSLAFMGCGSDSDPVAPVVAVDDTPPVDVIPDVVVDTAPPAVPSNLVLQFDGNTALVSWDDNTTDADFAGFLVHKTHYDDAVVTLVGIPSQSNNIADNNVLTGISFYNILAVDSSGNESAYATIQVVKEDPKTRYDLED
ncbi:MAG: hypothetical protein KOO60_10050 [Gemmatimonadales bacterium]|nr:hypothetical protein [Gemmatimonadales bacterium]